MISRKEARLSYNTLSAKTYFQSCTSQTKYSMYLSGFKSFRMPLDNLIFPVL
jgi:hypothetical protein